MRAVASDGAENGRRRETAASITACAQELVLAQGLDGFTLNDLAERSGVSRRTLFNYFPSKLDAVMGVKPDFAARDEAEFVAGGPTGDLLEDIITMVRRLVDTGGLPSSELARGRRVLESEPRLAAHANARLEQDCVRMAGFVIQRYGNDFGHQRAELLVRVLACTLDVALSRFLAMDQDSTPSWADVCAETIREVGTLFDSVAPPAASSHRSTH